MIGSCSRCHSTLQDRYKATGSVKSEDILDSHGQLTTRQQDRFVVLLVLRQRTATVSPLRGQTQEGANINVGDQMVCKLFRGSNLRSRWPSVCLVLTLAHCAACLARAQCHLAQESINRLQVSLLMNIAFPGPFTMAESVSGDDTENVITIRL